MICGQQSIEVHFNGPGGDPIFAVHPHHASQRVAVFVDIMMPHTFYRYHQRALERANPEDLKEFIRLAFLSWASGCKPWKPEKETDYIEGGI